MVNYGHITYFYNKLKETKNKTIDLCNIKVFANCHLIRAVERRTRCTGTMTLPVRAVKHLDMHWMAVMGTTSSLKKSAFKNVNQKV